MTSATSLNLLGFPHPGLTTGAAHDKVLHSSILLAVVVHLFDRRSLDRFSAILPISSGDSVTPILCRGEHMRLTGCLAQLIG